MKINYITGLFLSLALLFVMFSFTYAAGPLSDEKNPHNMSSSATHAGPHSVVEDQICVFCHTPHAAAPDLPLWNRPNPTTNFPLYGPAIAIKDRPDLTGYELGAAYPSGASRMCLSCHDGVTAIGILLNNDTIAMPSGSEVVKNRTVAAVTLKMVVDLEKTHPISFNYNSDVVNVVLDPNYYRLPGNPAINTPLDAAGQMQCTTCHDPHTDTRTISNGENLPFWRHTTVVGTSLYDDVCASCHWDSGLGPPATPLAPPHVP